MLEELNIQRLLIFILEQIMLLGFLTSLVSCWDSEQLSITRAFERCSQRLWNNKKYESNFDQSVFFNNVLDTISFGSVCRNNSNYKGICWDLTFDLPWSFIHSSLSSSEYKQNGPWHWTRSLMWNQDPPKLRTREGTPTSFPLAGAEEQTPVAKSCQGARQAEVAPYCCPWPSPFTASLVYEWILIMGTPTQPLFASQGEKPLSGAGNTLDPPKILPADTMKVWILNSLGDSLFTFIWQVRGAGLCPVGSEPLWACLQVEV